MLCRLGPGPGLLGWLLVNEDILKNRQPERLLRFFPGRRPPLSRVEHVHNFMSRYHHEIRSHGRPNYTGSRVRSFNFAPSIRGLG